MEIWATRASVDLDLLVTVIDYYLEHRPETRMVDADPAEPEVIALPEPIAEPERIAA